jgi:hypothetical protein
MWNVCNVYLFWKWSTIGGYDHQRETFLYMLQVTRNLHCTVPKDRFVTLSAFSSSDTTPDEFVESKRRTRAVYRKFARRTLEKMETLDLLSAIQHESTICRSSWIPKWNVGTTHTLAPLGSGIKCYDALSASSELPVTAALAASRHGMHPTHGQLLSSSEPSPFACTDSEAVDIPRRVDQSTPNPPLLPPQMFAYML